MSWVGLNTLSSAQWRVGWQQSSCRALFLAPWGWDRWMMCLHMLLNRGNNITLDMFEVMKKTFSFISAPRKSKLSARFFFNSNSSLKWSRPPPYWVLILSPSLIYLKGKIQTFYNFYPFPSTSICLVMKGKSPKRSVCSMSKSLWPDCPQLSLSIDIMPAMTP